MERTNALPDVLLAIRAAGFSSSVMKALLYDAVTMAMGGEAADASQHSHIDAVAHVLDMVSQRLEFDITLAETVHALKAADDVQLATRVRSALRRHHQQAHPNKALTRNVGRYLESLDDETLERAAAHSFTSPFGGDLGGLGPHSETPTAAESSSQASATQDSVDALRDDGQLRRGRAPVRVVHPSLATLAIAVLHDAGHGGADPHRAGGQQQDTGPTRDCHGGSDPRSVNAVFANILDGVERNITLIVECQMEFEKSYQKINDLRAQVVDACLDDLSNKLEHLAQIESDDGYDDFYERMDSFEAKACEHEAVVSDNMVKLFKRVKALGKVTKDIDDCMEEFVDN